MKPIYHQHYPTNFEQEVCVKLSINRTRLCALLRSGLITASDFECVNRTSKCIVRDAVLECAVGASSNTTRTKSE